MSAGVVTESLKALVAKQVADHRLVVWYDPERAYTSAAEAMAGVRGEPDFTDVIAEAIGRRMRG